MSLDPDDLVEQIVDSINNAREFKDETPDVQPELRASGTRDAAYRDNEQDTVAYCCRYFHNGTWWGLELFAFDHADAEARAKKLGNLQVLGKLEATIPVKSFVGAKATGLFVRALCWIRNLCR